MADQRRGGEVDALRVATWRLEATGTADPELLLRAAQLARMAHDFSTVRRLATAAGGEAEHLDIAERLVLSVRTVNNHLRAGYLKLGVSSRAGLRSALRVVG